MIKFIPMGKIIFLLTITSLFCSCSILPYTYYPLYNENGGIVDYTFRETGMSIECRLASYKDVGRYKDDSLSRFHYEILVATPELPVTKINYFVMTKEKYRDTIPTIFFIDSYEKPILIESLPTTFDDSINKRIGARPFAFVAESSIAFANTDSVFISYDIEVGDKRIVKKIRYKRIKKWDTSKWAYIW